MKSPPGHSPVVDAGERTFSSSKLLDNFGLKAMENLVGVTYRKPKYKEADEQKVRGEARKKLFAAPIPLPKRLLPSKSKAKYLQEWDRGRMQKRFENEQFQMRAGQHSMQKMQQEMPYEPR